MSGDRSEKKDRNSISRRDVLVGAAAGSAVLGSGVASSAPTSSATVDAPAVSPQADPDCGIPRYTALALQLTCDPVNPDDPQSARQRIARSLERYGEVIRDTSAFLKAFNGRPVKLVVLPEYFLTGFPMGESFAEWKSKAVLDPNGPEYEFLGRIAQSSGVYLSGNAYEAD